MTIRPDIQHEQGVSLAAKFHVRFCPVSPDESPAAWVLKAIRPQPSPSTQLLLGTCYVSLLSLWLCCCCGTNPREAAPSLQVLPRCSPLTHHAAPWCWILTIAALFKTTNRPRNSNSKATSSVYISGMLEYPTAVIYPATSTESEKNFYRLEIGFKLQCSYEKCNYS